MKHNQSKSIWIVTTLFSIVTIPFMFSVGMFKDGLIYSSISRNLANGHGSFSQLVFSDTIFAHFFEHPPLALWLHSIWYRVLGDHFFVDHIQTWTAFVGIFFIIQLIWKTILPKDLSCLWWFPIFIVLANEKTLWVLRNNLLDSTMALFTTIAIYLFIRSQKTTKIIQEFAWITLACLSIVAALYSKGPVGLFPLACPFIYFLTDKRVEIKKVAKIYIYIFLLMSLLFVLHNTFASSNLLESWHLYFQKQIDGRVLNQSHIDKPRFRTLKVLLNNIGLIFGLLYMSSLILKQKLRFCPHAKFLLGIGLCGSLPLMITSQQASFYLIPAFIPLSLSIALIFKNLGQFLDRRLSHLRAIQIMCSMLILGAVVSAFYLSGKSVSSPYFTDDLQLETLPIPMKKKSSALACPPTITIDSKIFGSAQRILNASLIKERSQGREPEFIIIYKDRKRLCKNVSDSYSKISRLNSKKFDMYMLK